MTSTLRLAAALTASVAVCAVGASMPAQAATSHHGVRDASAASFTIVTGGPDGHELAVLHGAVNGGGKDTPRGQTEVLQLGGGSLTLTHPGSQSTFKDHVDPTTCYVSFTLTGKFTVGGGTGRFAGVSGSGTYRGQGYGILGRTSGGSCDMKGQPEVELFQVKGSGTLA